MSTEQQQAAPSFQPFQRIDTRGVPHLNADKVLTFVSMASDIASGVCTILQMIEADHIESGMEDSQLILNDFHRGSLQRLAIASMNSLAHSAEGLIEYANSRRKVDGGGSMTTIALTIDPTGFKSVTDEYLCSMWHAAQINPAPDDDRGAADLVQALTAEILRRWLASVPPMLHARPCRVVVKGGAA